jgi:predicted ATP-grasp superfamily ATP-dependent carboligase
MHEFVQNHPSLVVIPTRDDEAEHLSLLRGKLGPHVRIAVSDPPTVRLCLEKQDTYRFAEEMGIPCPRTLHIGVGEHIPDRFDDYLMPCLVKPVRNCDFYMNFGRRKAFVCYDVNDVRRKLDLSLKAGFDMMVQELIPGADDTLWEYITCNGPDGRRLMEIISRKLCQNPPEFGVGCIRRSEKNEKVIDYSRRLFDKLGYCGIGETEFKYDQRDGLYKLLEINPRCVMPISLPVKCGLDMPSALYHAYAGNHDNQVDKPMPENVYWLHGGGVMRAALNPNRAGRWRYLLMFLHGMIKPHCWAVWHWRDPLPAWRDIRGRF